MRPIHNPYNLLPLAKEALEDFSVSIGAKATIARMLSMDPVDALNEAEAIVAICLERYRAVIEAAPALQEQSR